MTKATAINWLHVREAKVLSSSSLPSLPSQRLFVFRGSSRPARIGSDYVPAIGPPFHNVDRPGDVFSRNPI